MHPRWPPEARLPDDYSGGPYPVHELANARRVLIDCLTTPQGDLLERIKPKLGIGSRYGRGLVPPPMPRVPPVTVGPPIQYKPNSVNYDVTRSIPVATVTRHSPPVLDSQESFDSYVSRQSESGQGDFYSPSADLAKPGNNYTYVSRNIRELTAGSSAQGAPGRPNLVPLHSAESSSSDDGRKPAFFSGINNVQTDHLGKRKSSGMKLDNTKKVKVVPSLLAGATPAPGSDSEPGINPNGQVFQTYKCDFCLFTAPDFHGMKTHLVNAKHFSGSWYNARREGGILKFISIQQMLAVKNPHSKTAALVVSCPECKDVFEDIFMCGLHYKYTHGSVNGHYSVCPVVYHKTVAISQVPQCMTCKQKFSSHAELHKHWKETPAHKPYSEPSNPQVFMIVICPYCRKMFYGDFYNCESHVIQHKKNQNMNIAIEVKHVMIPRRKEELPPFNTDSGHMDGINGELTVLRNMRKHFKSMSHSKSKVANIRDRIKHLNTLVSGTDMFVDGED